ncbi:ankyrin domain-containing protein [Cystobasidium minutum MCA 4210]|uniref:ankyrin domain-containing protein n=1 Tax=Cystobasidium minutum MCA 4210 TaxID=1397322 RepID=UPI0034CD39C1|eukprot:jgi/Rhomi1/152618/estExt_Genewise1.C_4_t20079
MSESQSNPTNGVDTTTASSTEAPSVSTLPTEALELASKLFNYARTGDIQSLTTYIKAGIPVNLRNSNGDTFLMLASYHNHPELVSELIDTYGADLNILNDKGQSVLSGAVFKDYTEVVKVLVQKGGDKLDIRAGKPDAVQCCAMFKRWECAEIMGVSDEVKQLSVVLNPVGSRDAL